MRLPADDIESVSLVNFDVKLGPDLEDVIGVWICGSGSIFDHDFANVMLSFDELRLGLFWEMEVLGKTFKTVKSVMHVDGYGPGAFHWHVTDPKQGEYGVDLLYSDRIFFIHIVQGDCNNN